MRPTRCSRTSGPVRERARVRRRRTRHSHCRGRADCRRPARAVPRPSFPPANVGAAFCDRTDQRHAGDDRIDNPFLGRHSADGTVRVDVCGGEASASGIYEQPHRVQRTPHGAVVRLAAGIERRSDRGSRCSAGSRTPGAIRRHMSRAPSSRRCRFPSSGSPTVSTPRATRLPRRRGRCAKPELTCLGQ
jgi:hypothetical protein